MKHILAILSLTVLGVLLYNVAYFLPEIHIDSKQNQNLEAQADHVSEPSQGQASTQAQQKPSEELSPALANTSNPNTEMAKEADSPTSDIYESIMKTIAGGQR